MVAGIVAANFILLPNGHKEAKIRDGYRGTKIRELRYALATREPRYAMITRELRYAMATREPKYAMLTRKPPRYALCSVGNGVSGKPVGVTDNQIARQIAEQTVYGS